MAGGHAGHLLLILAHLVPVASLGSSTKSSPAVATSFNFSAPQPWNTSTSAYEQLPSLFYSVKAAPERPPQHNSQGSPELSTVTMVGLQMDTGPIMNRDAHSWENKFFNLQSLTHPQINGQVNYCLKPQPHSWGWIETWLISRTWSHSDQEIPLYNKFLTLQEVFIFSFKNTLNNMRWNLSGSLWTVGIKCFKLHISFL